nr:mucin-2 [Nothobranchius furzeri]
MLLSVVLLLLLLLVSTTQAGFYGYVFTYTVKSFQGGGLMGVSHATVGFSSCQEAVSVYCGGGCDQIDESSGEWCQKEQIWYWSDTVALHQADITYGSWTPNNNNVLSWRYVLYIELRNRSDTGKPNSSPQTTILPALRVPSNCQRNINLLTFDPDGDEVKCRYAKGSLSECNDCTPPSVLNLSSSCSLLFSPTNSSSEGPYAVQLMMEEFPRQNMTLTDFSGVKVLRTTSDFIGKTPLQFVLNVDPAAPSCTEGLYLPRFLPPTPDNGAQIFVTINQMVKIPIRAEATRSEITKLLFSGPHDVLKSSSGPGNFTLSWTASDNIFNQGQSHPICFVVQSNLSSSVFQSELRCVVVTVENGPTTPAPSLFPTNAPLSTASQTPMIMQSISTLPPTTQGTTMAPPIPTTSPTPHTPTSMNMPPNSTSPPGPSPTTPAASLFPTNAPLSTASQTPMIMQSISTLSPTTQGTTMAPPIPTTSPTPHTPTSMNMPPNSTSPPGPNYIIAMKMKISTTLSPSSDNDTIIKLIKDELKRQGLTSDITIRLLSCGLVHGTSSPPGG